MMALFLSPPLEGLPPSLLPCDGPGGVAVLSHPVHLSGHWPCPPRHLSHLSHQSHACCIFHVVSVWAGGWGPGPGPSGWTAGAWCCSWPLATGYCPREMGWDQGALLK